MNNKYYTPEIEEFHIGFEYESNLFQEGWHIEIFSGEFPLRPIFNPDPKVLRVKFLDKEDIESFGFTLTIDMEYEDQFFVKKENCIIFNFIPDDKFSIQMYGIYFIIKNKSELKQLLKMLDVV